MSFGVASNGLVFSIDSFNNKSYNVPLVSEFIPDTIPYTSYSFNSINEVIYDEDLNSPSEWTVSTNTGTINLSSTNNDHHGTKSIEFTNTPVNSTITFISNTPISNTSKIKFSILNKVSQNNRRLRFILYNSSDIQIGNYVEVFNGTHNYSSTILTWQDIEIPINDFGTLPDPIYKIEIVRSGVSTSNIYLDVISIEYVNNPFLISIPSNHISEWNTYISLSGNNFISLDLSGGLIPETYIVNSVFYDITNDVTVLYNVGNDLIPFSHSCIIDDVFSSGPLYIKIPNSNLLPSFILYTENYTIPLTLHLSGGTDHTETTSLNTYYLPMNNVYLPSISGVKTNRWNSYILSSGGSMSIYLDGSISEISITSSVVDSISANTLLYSFPEYITVTKEAYIDPSYTSFDCIVIYGLDFSRSMDLYTQNGTIKIPFNLSGGSIPETYLADTYYFDGYNTFIYNSDNTPTQYNDHIQFEIYVENIVQFTQDCIVDSWGVGLQSIIIQSGLDISTSLGLYGRPLTIYLSGGAIPETYIIDTYYFDGFYNYIYDSAYIGTLYNDHTKMTIMQPQVNGIQSPDYTYGTYSVFSQEEDIVIQYGIYYDGTDTYLYDDNGYGLLYASI